MPSNHSLRAGAAPAGFTLHHPALRCYDAEWRRLRRNPAALRRAASWPIVRAQLESLDEVLAAVGYESPSSPDGEQNLRWLVGHAGIDGLAAEVVVRRLLPGALSVAARHRLRRGDDALAELLGALWIAIRTFDPQRTPRCLAAALLGDAEYRAFRCGLRRRIREVPHAAVDDVPEPPHDPDPALQLARLVAAAEAAGLTGAGDRAFLEAFVSEPTVNRVASRLEVSERTIRNRRAKVTAKLRVVASAA